jgi:8-oxo-dGTP pyrophosphatase MutT (NUDIX family)
MISHQSLLDLLGQYPTQSEADVDFLVRTISFVESRGAFSTDRQWQVGHVTGSAWIVNAQGTKTLLLHHKQLQLWLNPGGHCDPFDTTIQQTALREAQEETGLKSLRRAGEAIFDIDIHTIPAENKFPEHQHYDLRFLFIADDNEMPTQNHETLGVQWVSISDLSQFTTQPSINRMVQKSGMLLAQNG